MPVGLNGLSSTTGLRTSGRGRSCAKSVAGGAPPATGGVAPALGLGAAPALPLAPPLGLGGAAASSDAAPRRVRFWFCVRRASLIAFGGGSGASVIGAVAGATGNVGATRPIV